MADHRRQLGLGRLNERWSAEGEISSIFCAAPVGQAASQKPVSPPNDELRSREYPTVAEVERLTKAARRGRYGDRDTALILVPFRRWAAGSRSMRPRMVAS
jgi:hypothetical protein